MTEILRGSDTDPLERIAIALVDEIRARPVVSSSIMPAQNPPELSANAAADGSPVNASKQRKRPASSFPDHFNLRLRNGDRERFDDYAYRHRLMKGEAFHRMLNLALAAEQEEGK